MRKTCAILLCLWLGACGKESANQAPMSETKSAAPWPRLKTIIIADLTKPEHRPVDLEAEEDKLLRQALGAKGRFHSALSSDEGACAIEVRTFYGFLVNGELQVEARQGKAKLVMEAEAHCPTEGRSAGEIETYRATIEKESAFSEVDQVPETNGIARLRALLKESSEELASTLYGQVTLRHASDENIVAALASESPPGVLMEAAAEAGERKLKAAVQHLVRHTQHKDEVVGLRAGAALGLIGHDQPGVISALAQMTEGPDHERHLIAVHAMGDIGGEQAARYLEALAVGHPRAPLREAARQAAKRAKALTMKADTKDRSRHDAPPGKGAEGQ